MNHTFIAASPRRNSGFTVVEVLVALVVLSVGLLGIAKLMLFASRSNDSAYLRSQATQLAYQILDDMRANRSAAIAHFYDTPLGTPAAPVPPCLGLSAQCSSSNLALYDVWSWKQRLAVTSQPAGTGALPGGTGQIVTTTSTTAPTVTTATITVQWDDSAAQSSFAPTKAPVGTQANMQIVLETIL
jgi:type IV pilus assembly protein PilV